MPVSRVTPERLLHTLIKVLVYCLLLLFCQISMAGKVVELSVQGAIGPATADYLIRGIEHAGHSSLILIKIDTPGGLDKSLRQIVQSMLTTPVPVVVYVAPSGARAASAGTYLIYASTVAAMAPGTHLGAASPVGIMGSLDDKGDKQQSTMAKKVFNDSVAYIRSLAQLRGRDISFAEKAVLDATTLTATEALKARVIEYIALDDNDLFKQINGLVVMQNGQQIKLDTSNPQTVRIDPDWRTHFLMIITDPTIAWLLLLLGIYGIFFELVNPGVIAPGVIGVVSIVIALYALQLLPVNFAGLALIVAGITFIIAEAFYPGFGILGLGGTIAFILGSILLIDTESGAGGVAWPAIVLFAALNILVIMLVVRMVLKARKGPLQHGTTALIGSTGKTIGPVAPEGQAVINGEIWNVHAGKPIPDGTQVLVIAAKGLRLEVKAIHREKKS